MKHLRTPPKTARVRVSATLCAAWSLCALATAGTALAAPHAHEHGAMKLDITVEGSKLTIDVEAPLDNLVGFERMPRTEAERRSAAEALATMRDGARLFKADEAAQCQLTASKVEAPVLEPGAKPTKGEHADLDASYEFTCAQATQLKTLEIGLFSAFKRTQRVDVEVAGLKGQLKTTLKRPASTVKLVR